MRSVRRTTGLMQNFTAVLKRLFTNSLEIQVSPDVVTVTWDGQSMSLRPVVHIAAGGPPVRVIGIAEIFKSHEPNMAIPVFGPLPAGLSRENWVEVVNIFMGYVVRQSRGGLLAVRPSVRVRGVGTLVAIPGGGAAQLLHNALLRGGARQCTVED
jgi:hypothetical protein